MAASYQPKPPKSIKSNTQVKMPSQ
uniref:Uncharacterized protein n=1 Tax=Rhizophora mucronata TaxID=61149 RepID=A0A2P2KPQ0_RHIMU